MKITKAKLTQILLDLIYLEEDMFHDGHVDRETQLQLRRTIDNIRWYYQFVPNEKEGK